MASASKEADRLRRLCERSMPAPAPGASAAAAAAGGLGSLAAPFLTRSTARGVVAATRGQAGAPRRGWRGRLGRRTGGPGAGGTRSPRRAALPVAVALAVAAVAAQRALARGAPRRPRGAGSETPPQQPMGAARGRGCRAPGCGSLEGAGSASPPPRAQQVGAGGTSAPGCLRPDPVALP